MRKETVRGAKWGHSLPKLLVGSLLLLLVCFIFFYTGKGRDQHDFSHLYTKRGDRIAYFDFTGSGLFTQTQIQKVSHMLATKLYGNAHPPSPCARATEELIEEARELILDWLFVEQEKRDDYSVVFTDGATEALRTVGEHFPWTKESTITYSILNHNSALGIREYARIHNATIKPFRHEIEEIPMPTNKSANNLLVFPAECNFSGKKIPLSLIEEGHRKGYRVMLDSAAYVPTNPLDIVKSGADYACTSFYKVFGYPTGLGALIAKKSSTTDFQKTYFGGGTVKTSFADPPVAFLYQNFEERYEDGTRNFLAIASLKFGFEELEKQGGMQQISEKVWKTTEILYEKLTSLTHPNGRKKVEIYGSHEKGPEYQGGVITFNLLKPDGSYLHFVDAEQQIESDGIVQLRTGCMCNPGACYELTGVNVKLLLEHAERNEHICVPESRREIGGVPVGAIRASLGWATTLEDVDILVERIGNVMM
uniref:Aminotransferase class V domain-containing protein n=1 Tax=Paramoeba aestuarina TaxID=180227 RepID=A0A7S4K1H8_9EUKA|mmetsp:Transcript_14459/g.22568  ORF Transcript_14459/g.22568 Transcript_14459/m.22568 type:complete len:479 (+) Transcript_14459:184-1620(+)